MHVIFDSAQEQVSSGDDVTLGFFLENRTDKQLPCTYRVERGSAGVASMLWRVDGPTNLVSGERGRGALSVRAPKNSGDEDETVPVRLLVSTGDPATDAIETCTLVVRPAAISLRPKVTANPDGTVGAKVSVLRRGRTALDAEVKFRHKGGWRFYPERPSITVHTNAGRVRVVAPRSRWYLPDVTLNPDGTVTVKVSLYNRGGVDANASIRLRHDDGWSFSTESPELTVRAAKGPVDVSARFRPAEGRHARAGDEVTVQLLYKGVPVADAGVSLHRKVATSKRATVAALLLPLALSGGGALLDESHDPAPVPAAATPEEATTTIAPPAPATVEPQQPPEGPRVPPPGADPRRPTAATPGQTSVVPTPTTAPPPRPTTTTPPTTKAPPDTTTPSTIEDTTPPPKHEPSVDCCGQSIG